VPVDPTAAWLEPTELHRASGRLKAADADGFLADADVRAPIPAPRNVASTTGPTPMRRR
jgi:hypothetical protein